MGKKIVIGLLVSMSVMVIFCGCGKDSIEQQYSEILKPSDTVYSTNEFEGLKGVPEYEGDPYIQFHGNVPDFSEYDMTEESYIDFYGNDSAGRPGIVMACIGSDSIGETFNVTSRCEVGDDGLCSANLISSRLTENLKSEDILGERSEVKLTRYCYEKSLMQVEHLIWDYIKETGNHVIYRVTPIYVEENKVAHGFKLDGYSVEDEGEGVSFNLFAYNVDPEMDITYTQDGSVE